MRDILLDLRPRFFRDFCGNGDIVSALSNIVASDRLPSAILFTGEPGSGKTTLCSIVARALSCANWSEGQTEPCGHCDPCAWQKVGAHPLNGVYIPPGAKPSERAFAEALKDVENGVALWSKGHRTVMTIDDLESLPVAHQRMLRGSLDNSWPAGNLLATSAEPEKMDQPLRQRMVEYHIEPPDEEELVEWCKATLTTKLGRRIEDSKAVSHLVRAGNMNFRSILKIMHGLVGCDGTVDSKVIRMAAMEAGYSI